jgi:bifunctional UDP-N-acetylglucosamine pyrophosphorylase / glucosamine-1-phosphate N-acetyltransferase
MLATAAIVLAAGQGTRMRSRLPKVLHPLAGRPILEHVLASLARAGIERPVVVIGHGGDAVEAFVADRATSVRQEPQRGTADAVRAGLTRVPEGVRQVVVTAGDTPLLPSELFESLVRAQSADGVAIALLSARMPDPTGYGRVVRDATGECVAIVEDADADSATRQVAEINVATYCFDAAWLRGNVGEVTTSAKGELYLTDLVARAVADGRRVVVIEAPRPELTMGINDRVQLAEAERLLRGEIAERHMRNGVTIVDPATTYIDAEVEIGQDARIEPWTVLAGATVIGQDAVIGPSATLLASRIGPRTRIWTSIVEESDVAEDVEIGPWSHLRPGCEIGPRCRIGNFAELKKSRVGAGTQQHHFSYLGDADVGDDVNIGAGVVTANFDGTTKHSTIIGAGAFIGVDTMLRAPLTIGPGARTGAGAVVTRDVAPGKTVVGMPARPIELRRRSTGKQPAAAGDRSPQRGGGANRSDA